MSFEDSNKMSLAQKVRSNQIKLKAARPAQIITNINSKLLENSKIYENLHEHTFIVDYSDSDVITHLVKYYNEQGFKVIQTHNQYDTSITLKW